MLNVRPSQLLPRVRRPIWTVKTSCAMAYFLGWTDRQIEAHLDEKLWVPIYTKLNRVLRFKNSDPWEQNRLKIKREDSSSTYFVWGICIPTNPKTFIKGKYRAEGHKTAFEKGVQGGGPFPVVDSFHHWHFYSLQWILLLACSPNELVRISVRKRVIKTGLTTAEFWEVPTKSLN